MTNIEQLYAQAVVLGVCSMFQGNESEQRLLNIFTTPQGLEFCKKHCWPSIDQMRQFDKSKAERAGIFIDCGDIEIHNASRIILIGNTRATLIFDDMALVKHNVVVIYGAQARIDASNWAVVFAEKGVGGGKIEVTKSDNAFVDER